MAQSSKSQAIKGIMTTDLVTRPGSTSLKDGARLMRDRDIGDILVMEGDRLQGIVTDRDIVVRCVAGGGDLSTTTLADACSPDLITVTPDTKITEAAQIMAERAIRRLPVVEDGRPVGVVTLGDLAVERDPKSALGGISAASPND
jgi:CBS domain-containing protein